MYQEVSTVFKGEPVRKLSANDKVDDEIWRKLDGN